MKAVEKETIMRLTDQVTAAAFQSKLPRAQATLTAK